MLMVDAMLRFRPTRIPHRVALAMALAAALSAGWLPGSATASSRTVDAVANARLIVEGGYGAALAAVPDLTGDGRSALVIGLP